MTAHTTNDTLRFMFDPACPWAWRASLWIRNVRNHRAVEVEWGLFSLEYANRESTDEKYLSGVRKGRLALRLLHLARERGGNGAIDALYLALGRARHERSEALDEPSVLAAALAEAGLDPSLLEEAQACTEVDETLQEEYGAAEETGAFGVPTLYFQEDDTPYFGPVIDPVPDGEEAVALYENLSGIARLPYFFELKRPRG